MRPAGQASCHGRPEISRAIPDVFILAPFRVTAGFEPCPISGYFRTRIESWLADHRAQDLVDEANPMDRKLSRPDVLGWIDTELESLRRQGLGRQAVVRQGRQGAWIRLGGRRLINFGSNDYLGLAADPRLASAAATAIADEGCGSGASPLISGRSRSQEQLERALAHFEGTEAALVFPSGYAANTGAVAALVGPGDVVFTDRKNHASLLDGCRLSRADVRVYPHGDCDRLAALLANSGRYRRRLIVTDGLFSMDGDFAPLGELVELAERHGAVLLVDEAHATGVWGTHGRGTAEFAGVEDHVPVRVGTLSKALGSAGGFVAGSAKLVRWLIHRARPYVFSTAPPPAAAAAATAALEVVRHEPHRREQLVARAEALRRAISAQGWNLGNSQSQIIPVILGTAQRASAMAARLRRRGLFVPAIRPPTVPDGQACLRISLTWSHTPEMLAQLSRALADLADREPNG